MLLAYFRDGIMKCRYFQFTMKNAPNIVLLALDWNICQVFGLLLKVETHNKIGLNAKNMSTVFLWAVNTCMVLSNNS